ncbi:MAG: recombination mediator RecR [Phycisphaerae bacterium]|jgi:recombination protein RecR|nr:recombination mediator RecR [Phycisphaerae bacterium]MDP7637064.1 recombination mediator RecR [Phycisphaerae bacterium]
MSGYAETIERLMTELGKLPGIGARTAERLAFHILKSSRDEALGLAEAIRDVKTNIRPCSCCFNLAEGELCAICADPRRTGGQICVVEQPKDLLSLESTGAYRGVYHVLMGHLAPLEGVEADDLTIDALEARVRAGGVEEVVLATNPTVSGDATSLYIAERLASYPVRVTRLARGLPAGGQIEYANKSILSDAINERREM